jgi:hypothetical protein
MAKPSAHRLLDEATRLTGLDDFGDEWFLGPLSAWVEDLEQGNLTEFGRRFLHSLAVRDLARRLRVLEVLRSQPEIADVPIPPILYVMGLPRSGTTLLHNALALHAHARPFLRWELMEPVPPPEAATYETDPRVAVVQTSVDKLRGSLLERMHWVNADEPEECPWGFVDAVSMLGQGVAWCMPHWGRFLGEEGMTPAFEHYRRVVQLLLWKHPVRAGGFLVLKAPQIARHIAEFAAVFPEAHFVVTDRDPFRCTVSIAVLGHSIVGPFCIENPLAGDGARDARVSTWVQGSLAALAAFTDAAPHRTTHVAYPDLVTRPGAVAQAILAGAGLPTDDGLPGQVESFLEAQRKGRRLDPPADLDTMGYGHDEVMANPVVDEYCRRFGVQPETRRLTGAQSQPVVSGP